MNKHGVEIFSNKLALEIRQEFLKLIRQGISPGDAVRQLLSKFKIDPARPEVYTTFWLALAAAQWQSGKLTEDVKNAAIMIIEEGYDLRHWDHDFTMMQQRQHVLDELYSQIDPSHHHGLNIISVRRESPFKPGDAIGYIMPSKAYMIFRVLKIHNDEKASAPICDICDWCGYKFPSNEEIVSLPCAQVPGTAVINGRRIKGHSLICIASHTQKSFPKYRAGIISRGLQFKQHSDIIYYTNWQYLDDCLNMLQIHPATPSKNPWWKKFHLLSQEK